MAPSLLPLLREHFPTHLSRWESLAAQGLEAIWWDSDDHWLVYVAVGAEILAHVTVDAALDTVRVVRLSAVVGNTLAEEADATSCTLAIAAPVGILALRATHPEGRTRLRTLHTRLIGRFARGT